MVVDEEKLNRMRIFEMLCDEGYSIVGMAGNGEEAIEIAYNQKPDVIIIDVVTSKMKGGKLAKMMASFSQAAIILLASYSYGPQSLKENIKDVGAMAYLVKPVTVEHLITTIEMVLVQKEKFLELNTRIHELQLKMKRKKKVDNAKVKVMDQFGMKEEAAYRFLQKQSMQCRLPMEKIAQGILAEKK